jgi:hypothetical protein
VNLVGVDIVSPKPLETGSFRLDYRAVSLLAGDLGRERNTVADAGDRLTDRLLGAIASEVSIRTAARLDRALEWLIATPVTPYSDPDLRDQLGDATEPF